MKKVTFKVVKPFRQGGRHFLVLVYEDGIEKRRFECLTHEHVANIKNAFRSPNKGPV